MTVSEKTILKFGRDKIEVGELTVGEEVVVMGNPGDDGVIRADFIRVFENNETKN